MDDDPKNERPLFFDLWPPLSFINCPECKCHWSTPRFGTHSAYFPAVIASENNPHREGLRRAHCPSCGILLPEVQDLIATGKAEASPVRGCPFAGTVSGIRRWLSDFAGFEVKLWKYVVSHSNLVLRIEQKATSRHAFLICMRTGQIQMPSLHWRCGLALEATASPDHWALVDKGAGVRIECSHIGIFKDVESVW